MSTQNWLPLTEYSAKYRVSMSTLRRRIKTGDIEAKFTEGKYLLKDGPLAQVNPETETIAPPTSVSSQNRSLSVGEAPAEKPTAEVEPDQFWRTTQGLLNEIKKAYSLILQEKEEQILQLKDEVADLKTLVRVLEDDNNRVKNLQPKLDFDLGLEV